MSKAAMKTDTVTLTRAQYEKLIARAEDAHDRAVVRKAETREKAMGYEKAHENDLPIEMVKELLDGAHPARVWRKHRGKTIEQIAAASGVPKGYLSEIETRKKPGSLDAMVKIAAALGVPLDDLTAWL